VIRDATDPREVMPALWGDVRGSTGWDVGANTGQAVSTMLGNGFRRVLAFEPCLESYQVLDRKYGRDSRVTLFSIALAAHRGKLALHRREEAVDSGQLVSFHIPPVPTGYQTDPLRELPYGGITEERIVACSTVDWYAQQYGIPDFITVDTEGGEVDVLRGAVETLPRDVRWLVEFHTRENFDDCVSILEKEGHYLDVIRHPHYPEGSTMWWTHGWIKARRM